IPSKASQLRAARPDPPYTMSSSGCSATSGSRLFISIRIAASCGQPLHVRVVPRGARTGRGPAGRSLMGRSLPMDVPLGPFCGASRYIDPPGPLVAVADSLGHGVEGGEVFAGQLQVCRGAVLLQVGDLLGAGDSQDVLALGQGPGDRYLGQRRAAAPG